MAHRRSPLITFGDIISYLFQRRPSVSLAFFFLTKYYESAIHMKLGMHCYVLLHTGKLEHGDAK